MKNSTKNNFRTNICISLTAIFFIFSGLQLNAQITINQDIFTNKIGKTYKEVLYETEIDIDPQLAEIKLALGPDQIYDFSGFNYIDSTVSIIEVMEVDPDDPLLENPELAGSQYVQAITLLPGSGGVEDTSMTYLYTSLEDGKWTVNGAFTMIDLDLDGMPDSVLQYFVPPSLQVCFPVTSTSEWFDSTNIITKFDGMEFVSSTMIDSNWVRGYGTLITPQGTAEALRVHNKKLTKNPFLPIVDESNDYDFVTADDMMSASIVVEDGRAFYSVRSIEDGPVSTFNLDDITFTINRITPNPFNNHFTVRVNILEGDMVEFRLIGIDGNRSSFLKRKYLSEGLHDLQLIPEDIPVGLYYLEVRSGRFVQHMPIHKI